MLCGFLIIFVFVELLDIILCEVCGRFFVSKRRDLIRFMVGGLLRYWILEIYLCMISYECLWIVFIFGVFFIWFEMMMMVVKRYFLFWVKIDNCLRVFGMLLEGIIG